LAAAPLALAGIGIFCSIIGVFTVRAKEDASFSQLLKGLHTGVWIASALIVAAAFGILYMLLGDTATSADLAAGGTSWWKLGLAIVAGLMAGNVIAHATEHYTSYEYKP